VSIVCQLDIGLHPWKLCTTTFLTLWQLSARCQMDINLHPQLVQLSVNYWITSYPTTVYCLSTGQLPTPLKALRNAIFDTLTTCLSGVKWTLTYTLSMPRYRVVSSCDTYTCPMSCQLTVAYREWTRWNDCCKAIFDNYPPVSAGV